MGVTTIDELPPSLEARFWQKVEIGSEDDCWHWSAAKNKGGYGVVGTGGRRTALATHVCLLLSGRPKPSEKSFACHKCDNPSCVNPHHLWWGDVTENNRDMHNKKRWWREPPKGEKNWARKLGEKEVLEIRESDASTKELSERYEVTKTLIWKIKKRHLWKHI